MIKLAWRNLLHDRTRLAISVGGFALAVVLILTMGGVFAGSEQHAVAYMRNQPAEIWLMQAGVENMHMSSSILPPETMQKVQAVEGVQEAVGLLYISGAIDLGDAQVYSYIFAVKEQTPFGGPWQMAEGSADPAPDEIVIDRDLALRYGLGLGDRVSLLGEPFTIAGLSRETFGIATSIAFVNDDFLAAAMGVPAQSASYILVQPESGEDLMQLEERLSQAAPEANVLSRQAFIASDQEMIRQMGVDIIRAMNGVAYVVGLMVIALTIYTATLERAREYGVLKAIGANFQMMFAVVFAQSFISSGLGLIVGAGLSLIVGAAISSLLPEMVIVIRAETVLTQIPILLAITFLAAFFPLYRIARLDPMQVFRA